jgi:hypothetical protein
MPSPRTEENACYFFNRMQGDQCRFISYHFEKDSDLVDAFADTAKAIQELHLQSPYASVGKDS